MATRTKANPDEIRHTKAYGRQSKNIIDARDKNGKTYKIENAKGKLDNQTHHNSPVTNSKSLKNVSENPRTQVRNIYLSRRKEIDPVGTGMSLKNKALGGSPTMFLKTKRIKKKKK